MLMNWKIEERLSVKWHPVRVFENGRPQLYLVCNDLREALPKRTTAHEAWDLAIKRNEGLDKAS